MAACRVKFFTSLFFFITLAAPALAQSPVNPGFAAWLAQLEQEAITSGISADTVHQALDNAMLDERVIDLDQKQPENTITFDAYVQKIVTPERIRQGESRIEDHQALLRQISERYGVPPEIIVALWGVESNYGRNSGSYNVVDSLMTLAYDGRRPDFFRAELLNALRILDSEHMPAAALRGSWAGAMGQCQFMPSTYLKYAVDYNGDGIHDIWTNQADIFASIANYLASEGWRPELGWGQEVNLTVPAPDAVIGLNYQQDIAGWAQMGVQAVNGAPLPNRLINASLIQPDGPQGRSFLVTDNFRALMRWNKSTYFATSVGLLADTIK